MENDYKPPSVRATGRAVLFACIGLLLLNYAANLFTSNKASGIGWLLVGVGLALIVLAVLWVAEPI